MTKAEFNKLSSEAKIEVLSAALSDMVYGHSKGAIEYSTGLPIERCKEIYDLVHVTLA